MRTLTPKLQTSSVASVNLNSTLKLESLFLKSERKKKNIYRCTMFSTALADVTGTHIWLDCAREREWGLKTGTCKVRKTDKVGITSQYETIKTMKTRCKATSTSILESGVGLTQPAGGSWGVCVVVVGVVVVVAMLGNMTGSHMWTDKLSNFQNFYFNALIYINVIFFANSISLLYSCSRPRPVTWLRLPPAVWE